MDASPKPGVEWYGFCGDEANAHSASEEVLVSHWNLFLEMAQKMSLELSKRIAVYWLSKSSPNGLLFSKYVDSFFRNSWTESLSNILHDRFVANNLIGFNWIILSRYYRYANNVEKAIEFGELAKKNPCQTGTIIWPPII